MTAAKQKKWPRFGSFILGLLAFVICNHIIFSHRDIVAKPISKDTALPYRTVSAKMDHQKLVGYIFYYSEVGGPFMVCSAIIRSVTPGSDDYKALCRLVVTDIMRDAGTDKIQVNIYDGYEAYALAEIKHNQGFQILNRIESDSVEKHNVAIYFGDMYRDNTQSHNLCFYPDARNLYNEREIFMPAGLCESKPSKFSKPDLTPSSAHPNKQI
jgi:hypothetical protein